MEGLIFLKLRPHKGLLFISRKSLGTLCKFELSTCRADIGTVTSEVVFFPVKPLLLLADEERVSDAL